jgi:hypothetical protein
MNHEYFEELMSRFLDDDLTEALAESLFSHCSSCKDCRQFMRSIMGIQSAILSRKPVEQMALGSGSSIHSVGLKSTLHLFRRGLRVALPIAATIAVMILAGLLYSPRSIEKETPAKETKYVFVKTLPELEVRAYYTRSGKR